MVPPYSELWLAANLRNRWRAAAAGSRTGRKKAHSDTAVGIRIDCGSAACYTGSNKRTGVDSDMDTLMEFSIQGDIFFFYDTLSDEEKETVRKCMREKYKGHIVANPKIDEFLEGLERDHGIKLKRLSVTSVIAV